MPLPPERSGSSACSFPIPGGRVRPSYRAETRRWADPGDRDPQIVVGAVPQCVTHDRADAVVNLAGIG
jgi:hypothetical protein